MASFAGRAFDIVGTLGEEMHHIHPLILDGDPQSLDNLISLSREEHVKLARWWNRLIRDLGLAEARGQIGRGMT